MPTVKHGLLLLVLLFLSRLAWAEPTLTPRYQFQPDQTLRYRVEFKGSLTTQSGASQGTPINLESSRMVTLKVIKIYQDGTTTLQVDTEEPNRAALRTFSCQVGPTGNIESGLTPEDSLLISGLFPELPEFTLTPNASWLSQRQMPVLAPVEGMNLPLKMVTRYVYQGQTAYRSIKCLKFGVETRTLLMENPDETIPIPAKYACGGNGTLYFGEGHLLAGEGEGLVEVEYDIGPESSQSRDNSQIKVLVKGSLYNRISLLP
ncbi:MAG: hypothetical protein V2A65_04495 [Candidatus Omnitrophota bacterium]